MEAEWKKLVISSCLRIVSRFIPRKGSVEKQF